jgi:alkanesulfonate monooxygenase SsuD/methylene tetrahydromethanopterin reductase-like flavin-dependent oxidoreductase (luciferase family)
VRDLPLSVLDQSPVAAGTTSGQALDKTIKLARRTEELGYRRFWVTEHHNAPAWASSAPAVLTGPSRRATWKPARSTGR